VYGTEHPPGTARTRFRSPPQGPPTGDFVCKKFMPTLLHILAIVCAIATAGTYWWGIEQSFFWIYPWYDVLLHIMGGMVIGFWACAVALRQKCSKGDMLILVLLVLSIGVTTWEIFEYVAGFSNSDYVLDTAGDVVNGFIGGLLVWSIISIIKTRTVHGG